MEYNQAERQLLLQAAKDSIKHGLEYHAPPPLHLNTMPPHLLQPGACFVTLHLNKQLRGCIGSLTAVEPLIVDVTVNAFKSAFQDPRFSPLTPPEFAHLAIEISVLSAPQTLAVSSEEDLLSKLQPGVHGLILADLGHRATFLPSVWDQLPDPRDFVIHLKNKAGWPSNYWSNSMRVETYTAELIS